MADTGSDTVSAPPPPRRAHTYSRLTTAIAVLALATAIYALLRLDATGDRLDRFNDAARTEEGARAAISADLDSLAERQQQTARALTERVDALETLPRQLEELVQSVEQLRGRAAGPERAWSRAEAMFLLELAQRRLTLDRDLDTAIVALESADVRLASLRDESVSPVRQQIARELQALRSVRMPDTAGLLARLASAEELAARLPVKGIVAVERAAFDRADLPEGMLARAWTITRRALSNLIVVRRVDDRAASIVTEDEALVRRQHLQLLFFSARNAIARHDAASFRSALASARRALAELFDLSDPAAQALLDEIQAMEPVDIDPALPDLSGSAQTLRRLMPAPANSQ